VAEYWSLLYYFYIIPTPTFLHSQIFFDEIKLINKEEWIFLWEHGRVQTIDEAWDEIDRV